MTVLKFVDEIDASPGTRLDLNSWTSASGIKLLRGFSPGMPAKRTQVSESGLADGGTFSSSVYGLRTLTIPLQLYGNADTRAETVHDLAVELDRDSNLLMYQPDGATHPVFFKTLPSTMVADLLNEGRDINEFTLEVQAQPFALGIRQDLISAQTVTNDPAAASRGLFVDLGTPLGDVPTPPFIWTDAKTAIAANMCVETSPPGAVYFFQAEAGTNGTDTADQADANFSGGNGVRVTFATDDTMRTRVSHTFPTTMPPGAYVLFARVDSTAAGSVFNIRPRYLSNATASTTGGLIGDTTTWTGTSGVGTLLNLGLVQFPAGSLVSQIGESGNVKGDTPRLNVQASRESGAASLDIDYLLAVPATGVGNVLAQPTHAAARLVVDGPNDAVYCMTGTSPFAAGAEVATHTNSPALTGSIPMLEPGVPNRLMWFGLDSPTLSFAIADTWDLSVSYWPRYLWLRPSSS